MFTMLMSRPFPQLFSLSRQHSIYSMLALVVVGGIQFRLGKPTRFTSLSRKVRFRLEFVSHTTTNNNNETA